MGKKSKSFMNVKTDNILEQYGVQQKRPQATLPEVQDTNKPNKNKPNKNKRVAFQLREDIVQPEEQIVNDLNDDGEAVVDENVTETEDNVFPDDGYDYGQHLRDPNLFEGIEGDNDGCEVYTCNIDNKPKKSRAKNSLLQGNCQYEAPERDDICPLNDEDMLIEDFNEEKFNDLFGDADLIETEQVTEIDPVTADDDVTIFGMFSNEDCHPMHKIDHENMPPLEEDSDEDRSDNDDLYNMDCSDSEDNNEQMDELCSKVDRIFDVSSAFGAQSKEMTQEAKDNFFECGFYSEANAMGIDDEERTKPSIKMESSKGVRKITSEMEAADARVQREAEEYGRYAQNMYLPYDDGNKGIDVNTLVNLSRESKAAFMKERISIVGEGKLKETEAERLTKQKAIEYSKRWKESEVEYKQITVPDPRSMVNNVTTIPAVKNNNFPKTIDTSFPKYFKQQNKMKGLTLGDVKKHDKKMKTPVVTGEDDAMTYKTYKTMLSELSYRPLDESLADKRERKGSVKVIRKFRREEKKVNTIVHKTALLMTQRANINAKHCKALSIL